MPKKSVKIEVNNFVKGLITEASPLNFPADATFDEVNFVLNRDGTRQRRRGLDFENNFELIALSESLTDIADNPPVPFKWSNAAGSAGNNFLTVHTGNLLRFFNMNTASISGTPAIGSVDVTLYGVSPTAKLSFASVDGKLVVVGGVSNILVITYKAGLFNVEVKSIQVRDVWGVEVTEDLEYETDILHRTVALPTNHLYNLYNQSWGLPRQGETGSLIDPAVDSYPSGTFGRHPSNSETVWVGMQFQPVSANVTPSERIFPTLYEQSFGASVKAAKGHFIIDLLKRGASRSENITRNGIQNPAMTLKSYSPVQDSTTGGATAVAEFAGRVFYGGFEGAVVGGDNRSPTLSNYLLFSQLVRNTSDVTKCYQEGDPTSRESNDLIDTDGGFIRISGADTIVGMLNLSSVLVVFANNGVWIVSGGSDYGFSATNYKAERISAFGAISRTAIVDDGTRAIYWSEDGIYAVAKDKFGIFQSENITQTSIQSLYDAIPNTSKRAAIGVFDAVGKKLRWVYHEGDRFTATSVNKELILDLTLGAFYPFLIGNIPSNTVELIAPFESVPFVIGNDTAFVRSGVDEVISGFEPVVIDIESEASGLLDTRYLVVQVVGVNAYMTFAYYSNKSFLDWELADGVGVDAAAFLTTGAITGGDSSVEKQAPYLTMHFVRTEEAVDNNWIPTTQSSCLVRSQWAWASSANANKWGPLFQAYRYRKAYLPSGPNTDYDNGLELTTTKSKLRGRGKALALHMETEPLKDCQIVGWSIAINGNTY